MTGIEAVILAEREACAKIADAAAAVHRTTERHFNTTECRDCRDMDDHARMANAAHSRAVALEQVAAEIRARSKAPHMDDMREVKP